MQLEHETKLGIISDHVLDFIAPVKKQAQNKEASYIDDVIKDLKREARKLHYYFNLSLK